MNKLRIEQVQKIDKYTLIDGSPLADHSTGTNEFKEFVRSWNLITRGEGK